MGLKLPVIPGLLGALWWTDLVTPRLDLGDTSSPYDHVTGRATAHFELRNSSLVAVEALGVTLGGRRAAVVSTRVNGRDIRYGGQKIAGGGGATINIELTCRPADGDDQPYRPATDWVPTKIEIMVRMPIRIGRTRVVGHFGPLATLGTVAR